MWGTLGELGVPTHLVSLIKNLYEATTEVVKIENSLSGQCRIEKGVRQGCILSPPLYNGYSELVMRIVLAGWRGVVKIGGRRFSNLRFADDTMLIAASEEELLRLLDRLERVSRDFGLTINAAKTKIMIVDRDTENDVRPARIGRFEVVDKFVYLGSLLHCSGSCEFEIRRRIEIARSAMTNMQKLWKDRSLTRATKIRLVNTLIFPIFLYASETWVIRSADRKRIDAFEMWVWRRMLRIPWTARRTNASVLAEINPPQRLSAVVYGRILKFFGHIARHDTMERLVVQGRPEGKRQRGRSPTRWTDAVTTLLGENFAAATRNAADRTTWRRTVQRVLQQLDG